jgi:hypothetical protein
MFAEDLGSFDFQAFGSAELLLPTRALFRIQQEDGISTVDLAAGRPHLWPRIRIIHH